ncbi:MAG: hypothetical protein HYS13_02195 [Planctomycetia bacterium]|nr:hypothetical protein [Planctomycetia bacterium]
MPRKPNPTAADYVAVAVTPALIMFLVGSLVFFLADVFYRGMYEGRVHWVLALYVFAIVLVARIDIESGKLRAVMFGIPLGLAALLVLTTFVQYNLPFFLTVLINLLLLGVIWWSAHKLTWDCSYWDDGEKSTAQGLLHTAGLAGAPGGEAEKPETKAAPSPREAVRLDGTTSRDTPPEVPPWQKVLDILRGRTKRPQGVWVVYFSLAALPLFGLGQWLIPAADQARWRFMFTLLCVYVASALGLLMTSAFLGMRRYLRQREVEMPPTMAVIWVACGTGMIVLLLILSAVIPRPTPGEPIYSLPGVASSPELHASRYAPLDGEGAKDPSGQARTASSQSQGQQGGGQNAGGQNSGGQNAGGQSAGGQQNSSSQPQGPSGQQGPSGSSGGSKGSSGQGGTAGGGQNQGGSSSGQSASGQSNSGQSNAGQSNAGKSNAGQPNSGQSTSNTGQSNTGQSNTGQSKPGQSSTGQSGSGQNSGGQSSSGQSQPGQSPPSSGNPQQPSRGPNHPQSGPPNQSSPGQSPGSGQPRPGEGQRPSPSGQGGRRGGGGACGRRGPRRAEHFWRRSLAAAQRPPVVRGEPIVAAAEQLVAVVVGHEHVQQRSVVGRGAHRQAAVVADCGGGCRRARLSPLEVPRRVRGLAAGHLAAKEGGAKGCRGRGRRPAGPAQAVCGLRRSLCHGPGAKDARPRAGALQLHGAGGLVAGERPRARRG